MLFKKKKKKKKGGGGGGGGGEGIYNLPFSMIELKQSLQRANNSATGLDQVQYQLLFHLPNSA